MVNLEWFRTFKAIYEEGTLTSAADKIYCSQPSVSNHLSSLEAYLGRKLFDRSGRKMIPTEYAKILYGSLAMPMRSLQEIEQNFKTSKHSLREKIQIGICPHIFEQVLEKRLSSIPFDVTVRFDHYKQLIKGIEDGELDLILAASKGMSTNVLYEDIFKTRMIIITDNSFDEHVFSDLLAVSKKSHVEHWLSSCQWFAFTSEMNRITDFWIRNFGHDPSFTPQFVVPDLNAIIRCIVNGTGVALVPEFLCQEELSNKRIKLLWRGYVSVGYNYYLGIRKCSDKKEQTTYIRRLLHGEID